MVSSQLLVVDSEKADSEPDATSLLLFEYSGGWMSSHRHGQGMLIDYVMGTLYEVSTIRL